jgi:pimeloyl-ACP methyl ester carboxylesterase
MAGGTRRETAALLEKGGHRVHVVEQMPSAGHDPESLGDLRADADCVREVVGAVKEPVVLVGHSYGGMVITEFADHPSVVHTVVFERVLAATRAVDRRHARQRIPAELARSARERDGDRHR